jgi:AmiR/NasT family two-component response regulator
MLGLMESLQERDEWELTRRPADRGATAIGTAGRAPSSRSHPARRTCGRVQVMVCEADPWAAEWLRQTLQAHDLEVCGVARDGLEAFTLALTSFPDVVVTDLWLPEMDGVELTRRLSDALPTPIVVLAGPRDGRRLQEALAAGAVGYLVKPFAGERLRPAIEGALRIFAERAAFYAARGPLAALEIQFPGPGPAGGGSLIAAARQALMREEHLSEAEALDRLFQMSSMHMESLEEAAAEVVRACWGPL